MEQIICPKCGSDRVEKSGHYTWKGKTLQRFHCLEGHEKSYFNEEALLDPELVSENVRYKKQTQKFQDTNRIERKAFRENARIENALEEYTKELLSELKQHAKDLAKVNIPILNRTESDYVGVIHITDWHCNELINLPHNKYDYEVLAKRAYKLAREAIRIFNIYGINNVLIAATGDFLNSDRRLDELLNQATNRSKATILSVHILKQFIIHLRQYFNVNIVSVLGNESRVGKDMMFSNNVISDNYDFAIFSILKEILSEIPGINFGSIDKMEEIVNVNGQNWLMKHDYSKGLNSQKDVQSTIGRYSLAGYKIDYVIGGHTHATRLTDISSRASSMPGSNEYNENALDLHGRSGQPLYIVGKNERFLINIDLQNTDGIEGYSIVEKLKEYNAKSHDKTIHGETILKITI